MREATEAPRLTVLFVVPSLAGGGAERCALEVLKNLDPALFERHLLPFVNEGEYVAELPADLIVDRQRGAGSRRRGLRLPRLLRKWIVPVSRVADAIRRTRPDVVVTFLPEASLPTSLVRWLRLGPDFLWLASEQNATRRRVVEGNPGRWRRWLQDRWIQRAYRAADGVVAVSEGVKEGLLRDYGLDGSRISVILNPVDRQRVESASARALPRNWQGTRFIVSVGRLTRQKGLDILLEAVALVRLERPVDLVLLGSGEERERLEALARELRIDQHVHFLGFQANPWPYVRRAEVFVLSSRWEGCPLVIAEAMACGTPIVASDCDYGPRELIEPGSNGLLVPPEDPPALADAISRLLDDPESAKSLSRAGTERARDLDISVIARQYGRLFRHLAAGDQAVTPPQGSDAG